MEDELKGYKGIARTLLEKNNLKIWDIVTVKTEKSTFEGVILPRYEHSSPEFIEIKLENNYNVGILAKDIQEITKIGEKKADYRIPEKKFPKNKDLPNVTLLGTGGTVASRLDYITGGVIPAFTPGELFSTVPELAEICNVESKILFKIFSENMEPHYWQKIAKEIESQANNGTDGVIIAHGTDTMGLTSAALSFMLKDLSIPVVLVGSQRSSDRPSSDAALNLINAANVATSNIAEVVVCMLGTTDHEYGVIHRGTLVRKMHSSVRHAFRTIDNIPLGYIKDRNIHYFQNDYKKRNNNTTKALTDFEEKVALVYSYPGLTEKQIEYYIDNDYRGIVLGGTGLGHVNSKLINILSKAIKEDITILMTTQTLHGFVGMNVYSTGRQLEQIGVISGKNMIPEVAYVKLGWVLGQTDEKEEIENLLTTNLAGEFVEREIPPAFNYKFEDLLNSSNNN
ncbi:MAG: Glu-tRNA(Gln) amidotransferase subunit GatD [Candidatus Lokiarchaeota archaeon]